MSAGCSEVLDNSGWEPIRVGRGKMPESLSCDGSCYQTDALVNIVLSLLLLFPGFFIQSNLSRHCCSSRLVHFRDNNTIILNQNKWFLVSTSSLRDC
uniref:Uncharacterized protein n=1 Tax=Callorhinchus milii TaxID=7868 RepID=A0A4W3J973_CALMI